MLLPVDGAHRVVWQTINSAPSAAATTMSVVQLAALSFDSPIRLLSST